MNCVILLKILLKSSSMRMFRYGVLLYIFLSVFLRETYSCYQEGTFYRNISYDNMVPSSAGTLILNSYQSVSRSECALQCLLRKPECAGVVYWRQDSSCDLHTFNVHKNVTINRRIEGSESWSLNDLCPRDWVPYDGHCYFLNETMDTWSNAKNICEKHGAHLVEIETTAETHWIQYNFLSDRKDDCQDSFKCCYCWIGATDLHTEGVFTWNFHTNVTFDDFNEVQPKNSFSKDCVRVCKAGYWDVENCNNKHVFICEKKND